MVTDRDVEAARLAWTNARSSRVGAERLLETLKGELAQAEARVVQQEQVIAMAFQRETSAKEFYAHAERENTAEAKAAAAARELAEKVQALKDRQATTQALVEKAQRDALMATAALTAFVEEQASGQGG